MKLYGAIDLHSTNSVTVVINEQDQVVYQKRLPNDLSQIAQQLSSYRRTLQGIVVESTYNWYWLVDGLKYTDDDSDARWLAHLETREIERFASVGNYASYCRCVGSKKSATASVKGAAIPKTATSIWPGRLWRPRILRSGLIRRSKASIRKRNPRAMRLWPSKRWRTSSAGLVITLSKIRFRLILPRRLPSRSIEPVGMG